MLTTISNARLAEVHPELSRRVRRLDLLLPLLSLQVAQGLRTVTQQDALWAIGRTKDGQPCEHDGISRPIGTCPRHPKGLTVTKARGGWSAHNFGYAVDLVPEDMTPGQPDWNISSSAWKNLLAAGPSCGLAEGAEWRTFPDNPHFYLQELPATPSADMRRTFPVGGLPTIWEEWVHILKPDDAKGPAAA
jgi:peptidoglycan LD-endopeptidase CwlK